MRIASLLFLLFFSINSYSSNNRVNRDSLYNSLMNYKKRAVTICEQGSDILLQCWPQGNRTLNDLDRLYLPLAGERIDPKSHSLWGEKLYDSITIYKRDDKYFKKITTLTQGGYFDVKISPKGNLFAFLKICDNGVELHRVKNGSAELLSRKVHAIFEEPYKWSGDSIFVREVPDWYSYDSLKTKDGLGKPLVLESSEKRGGVRTYQDLLKDSVDIFNFRTLSLSNLTLYLPDLLRKRVIEERMVVDHEVSPNGRFLIIDELGDEFSFFTPHSKFKHNKTVIDLSGNHILNPEKIGHKNGSFCGWRLDRAASFVFSKGDTILSVDAPFESTPQKLIISKERPTSIYWSDGSCMLFSISKGDTIKRIIHYFANSSSDTIFRYPKGDSYATPGNYYVDLNTYGKEVVRINKHKIYLVGERDSDLGKYPFIEELNLQNGRIRQLYKRAHDDKYEKIVMVENPERGEMISSIESQNTFPELYYKGAYRGRPIRISNTVATQGVLANVKKLLIAYYRSDSVKLYGMLYLPSGYRSLDTTKPPILLWGYPREFRNRDIASRLTINQNEYTIPALSSFIYLISMGYAVLDDASFPIIGEDGKEPNDSYLEQLKMNASAALDAVAELGYADTSRAAVGGHSYGAFMTANLLTHTALFKCGVARSGAYNRTLTPFGFQNEKRDYWESPDLYNKISPFMNAHKMKYPILLIHGERDNNPGTFTMQSERYYHAIMGLGGRAKLIILPGESHGYVAGENILFMMKEIEDFLNKNLRGK